ncbi:S-adenosylmethionine-dependent methyltransferase [Steccherinum ochraceum]|uniref:S-adenosylmethionine-dependent methyltransferase n=1 Tax=Steccherinum ochraceum TaxID=92696 RepID=A0A4R0R6S6_9APHY|nr:S-adenosylmethionine-dependent methyltransferase [Steccherinum ochraceum]
MIPTPDLSHLTRDDYDRVYEPAEDTFILLDALEEDAEELRALRPRLSLEIGTGHQNKVWSMLPGYVLAALTHLQIPLESVTTYLAAPLLKRVHHAVDILIFNPPYVPTYDSESQEAQDGKDIRGSWAGGTDGMRITDILLECVDGLLSPRGRFYLVAVKENNIPELQRRMRELYDLESKIILQRRAGREHLHVICFMRNGRP